MFSMLLSLWLGACADLGEDWPQPSDQDLDSDIQAQRMARIHLRLESQNHFMEGQDWLKSSELAPIQIRGHFAEYRGLVPNFVRAYIHAPEFAWEWLEPSKCGVQADLIPLAWSENQRQDDRELALLDVGDIYWRYGDNNLDVSLRLLPDLMPYVSGVEYFADSSWIEQRAHSREAELATLHIEGNGDREFQPLVFSAPIPPTLQLDFDLSQSPAQPFRFQWKSDSGNLPSSNLINTWFVLRLQGVRQNESTGQELICLVSNRKDNGETIDHGAGTINLAELAEQGLDLEGDGLKVAASHISESIVQVGPFANTELLIEREMTEILPWVRKSLPSEAQGNPPEEDLPLGEIDNEHP